MTASAATEPGLTAAGPCVLTRLRWWEIDALHRIERDVFEHDPWSRAQFWSELARVPESRWYTVARRAGELVGYAGLLAIGTEADVQTIAVAPAARGIGAGRQLLSALMAQASSRGAGVLRLEVRADNAAARALYERAGFVPDGRRRDYYGLGTDAILMSRRLRGPGPGVSHG